MKTILQEHSRRYPQMQPQDYVKLLYQNVFGCGHFVEEGEASLRRLEQELEEEGRNPNAPLLEEMGNGYLRFHLPLPSQMPISTELLHRIFVESSKRGGGSLAELEQKGEELLTLCQKGELPLSVGEAMTYWRSYQEEGYPMVSHTPLYRERYLPKYRVIAEDFALYLPVIQKIAQLLWEKQPVVFAIEGRCGSGKSTLAKRLQALFSAEILPMDDFFLPPLLATPQRLAQAGGNLDSQRFLEQVVMPFRQGKPLEYGVYSCREGQITHTRTVKNAPLLLIEGSYSCHPLFGDWMDGAVFLTVSPQVQQERIRKRNGAEMAEIFAQRWIPMEEQYFQSFSIPQRCTITLATDGLS